MKEAGANCSGQIFAALCLRNHHNNDYEESHGVVDRKAGDLHAILASMILITISMTHFVTCQVSTSFGGAGDLP